MEIRLTRVKLVVAGVLLAGVALYFLLDWLILTDVERVEMTLDGLATAVKKNDADAVMPFLDPSFRIAGMNPEEFHGWYGDLLKRMHVVEASQYDRTVKMDPAEADRATAEVLSIIRIEEVAGDQRIDWRLEFRRRGRHDWRLVGVRAFLPPSGSEIPIRSVPDLIP